MGRSLCAILNLQFVSKYDSYPAPLPLVAEPLSVEGISRQVINRTTSHPENQSVGTCLTASTQRGSFQGYGAPIVVLVFGLS